MNHLGEPKQGERCALPSIRSQCSNGTIVEVIVVCTCVRPKLMRHFPSAFDPRKKCNQSTFCALDLFSVLVKDF